MPTTFDASSMIYAWDNYPANQFPPMWRWMASEIKAKRFSIPKIAFDEVKHKAPECADWLMAEKIDRISISNEIVQFASRIKGLLKIKDDKYSTKGVGENDIFIIATAAIGGFDLVSNERRQTDLPTTIANAKIPAVCQLEEVAVHCLNFIELIKQSQVVFE